MNRWHFAACMNPECGHDGHHAHLFRPDGVVSDNNRPYRHVREALERIEKFAEDCMLSTDSQSAALQGLRSDVEKTEIFLNDEFQKARLY